MKTLQSIINRYDFSLTLMLRKLNRLIVNEEFEACSIYKSEIDSWVVRQCKVLISNDHNIIYPEGESLYSAVLDFLGFYYQLTNIYIFNNRINTLCQIDRQDMLQFCSPLLKQVNDFYESQLIEVEI